MAMVELQELLKVYEFKKNYKGLYIEFKSRDELIKTTYKRN